MLEQGATEQIGGHEKESKARQKRESSLRSIIAAGACAKAQSRAVLLARLECFGVLEIEWGRAVCFTHVDGSRAKWREDGAMVQTV